MPDLFDESERPLRDALREAGWMEVTIDHHIVVWQRQIPGGVKQMSFDEAVKELRSEP